MSLLPVSLPLHVTLSCQDKTFSYMPSIPRIVQVLQLNYTSAHVAGMLYYTSAAYTES